MNSLDVLDQFLHSHLRIHITRTVKFDRVILPWNRRSYIHIEFTVIEDYSDDNMGTQIMDYISMGYDMA